MPAGFSIRDSINCNFVDITKPSSGNGAYTNSVTVNACKNSRMRYGLNVNAACYPTIIYTLVSVSGGVAVSSTGNQFTIQWGGSNIGNVVIAFNIPAGAGSAPCIDTLSINFNLVNTPLAAFSFSPQPACFNSPTNISFNSSASVNAVNYFWDFGDGFTSTLAKSGTRIYKSGTYTVTLIVTNSFTFNGVPRCPTCINSIQHTVVIGSLPGPGITCVASVCAGTTEKYCTNATGCTGFTWTVTGGTITAGQNTPCVTILWGSGNPQGTLSLVTTGCPAYCPLGTTVTIPIIPLTGTISGPPSPVCVNSTLTYSLPSWPGTTYNWTVNGGGIITPFNTNTNEININWISVGSWIITATYFDTALNCGGTATFPVNVRPLLNINGPSAICRGLSTTLTATRTPAVPVPSNWVVSPAGATITSGQNTAAVTFNWPVAGTYTVTATALAAVVCEPATYVVTVFPSPVLTSINGADSICANQTNVYSVTSNSTGMYSWNVTNGTPTLLGANNDSVQIAWAAAGPYSISVFQVSFPNNCVSNTLVKNVFKYPAPAVTGPVNVCADNIETYTITNIASGNFQWYVTPASFGTILSGQGTASVQIKWHGNNNPGFSNTVYLHFGVCNADSIAIIINEPPAATITASGTLCGPGGITLSTGATGIFLWTGVENPAPPPVNNPNLTGITLPGHYNVQIQNYNGTGCTVTAGYFVPDTGRPIAQISATNVLTYCFPNAPNMNLVAANGPGYTFQWYNTSGIILGATNQTLPINTITAVGTYSYYCIVSLGGCSVTSNILTIVIINCPGGGCTSQIDVTNIAGCNPFTLTMQPLCLQVLRLFPAAKPSLTWKITQRFPGLRRTPIHPQATSRYAFV